MMETTLPDDKTYAASEKVLKDRLDPAARFEGWSCGFSLDHEDKISQRRNAFFNESGEISVGALWQDPSTARLHQSHL